MFRGISGPFVRWWALSLLLHLAVIGCLLVSLRLRSETRGAVQVVLVNLSDGRPGTGPAGGGGRGGGHSAPTPAQVYSAPGSTGGKSHRGAGQKRQMTAETAMKPSEVRTRPEVANPPSRKHEKGTAHPNVPPKRPSPSRPGLFEDEQEVSVRPEGDRSPGTDTQIVTAADEGRYEHSSPPARSEPTHNLLGLGGGPGWGRGGGYGSGIGTGTGPGAGLGSGDGTDWRLLILERIHRAKRYPPLARQRGMEGTAVVQFRIAGDGGVEDVVLVQSSGYPLLDRASVETIRRAAPLPVIPGTIHIPISYRLRDAQ